jgi:hypothetical protein
MAAFTALNNGSPKTTEPTNGTIEVKIPGADDRVNGQPTLPEPKPSTETPTSQREGWTGSSVERSSYQAASYSEADSSHKRKRSDSVELRREPASAQERSPDTATASHPESRDLYTPQQQREYRHYGDETPREHNDSSWYSRHRGDDRNPYDSQQHSATSTHGQSEEQIVEALRRAGNPADPHSDYPQTSPDGEDRPMAMYGGPYSPDQRRDPVLQSDPKKRKRNFSNRTKTGCLTCRKRKKKCDEQKPECKCGIDKGCASDLLAVP